MGRCHLVDCVSQYHARPTGDLLCLRYLCVCFMVVGPLEPLPTDRMHTTPVYSKHRG